MDKSAIRSTLFLNISMLYLFSTRVVQLLSLFSSDCTRGIDEPPKEIGKFPFHTILVIDKSMYVEGMELT